MTLNALDRYVIVTTPWCTITPKLKNKIARLENAPFVEEKDASENHKLMNDFNITKIPTLMHMYEGKEVKRLEGVISSDKLKEFFNI